MRSANVSVQYSTRHEKPRARTCGWSRLRPSDGEKSGPNGIETRTTSVIVGISAVRQLERRGFAAGGGGQRVPRIAALPRGCEVGVGLLRLRRLPGTPQRTPELQLREGVERMRWLIAAAGDDLAELADRPPVVVDGSIGQAANVRQPGPDQAV